MLMKLGFAFALTLCGLTAIAADAPPASLIKNATFSITGLHCPPCAGTVERALTKLKGVKSAKVNFASKSATVEFDESVATAQGVATAIADTPHMMGADMSYSALLALSVPAVKDETSAQHAKEALTKVTGVSKVNAYPQQHTVSVRFAPGKDVTSDTLIEALGKAGMDAKTY